MPDARTGGTSPSPGHPNVRDQWWEMQMKVRCLLEEQFIDLLDLLPPELREQWEDGVVSLVDILPVIAEAAFPPGP